MGFWSAHFGKRKPSDGGAVYDPVEGGKPIPLDEEEADRISAEAQREEASLGSIFDNINDPSGRLEKSFRDAVPPFVAERALSSLAAERYEQGKYRTAANTAMRALAFSSINKSENDAILWQLLARIHMTVGRFETAGSFLKNAERAYNEESEPKSLRDGWAAAMDSLWEDIGLQRSPRPSRSMHLPTSVSGWFDQPQDV